MKIVSNNKMLVKEFVRLVNTYPDISFAVAWASANHPVFSLLKRKSSRIKRAIIGTHFYQTHPDVLDSFKEKKNVRFIFQTEGVFHPKIYLFRSKQKQKWEALIGSANLTTGALSRNSEVMILIGGAAGESIEPAKKLSLLIETYWKQAKPVKAKDARSYRELWVRKQSAIKNLSGHYGSGKTSKSAVESSVMTMPWRKYFRAVTNDMHHGVEDRTALLTAAASAFSKYGSFKDMPLPLRKTIAGLPNDQESRWGWFGSMGGAGYYHQAVKDNNKHLSNALDKIPLRGTVSKREYDAYIGEFIRAFPNGKHGVGVASRLLALKRPDQFVCLDSKNKANLCKDFGIKPTGIDYKSYWDEIVERIVDAPWWNSEEPSNVIQQGVWRGRAAMLDAIFYEE